MFEFDLNEALDPSASDLGFELQEASSVGSPTLIGDGEADGGNWGLQTTGFTCAVVSQQMILREFGIEMSEAELVYEATAGGFLTDGGTSIEDMGRLLDSHGVQTHHGFGIEGMVDDLSHGRKVIVAVDCGEIWGTDFFGEDYFSGSRADHALVVSGLDLSDRDNPMAVLNDPGTPDGAAMRVPLEQFLDAWNDSGQTYVATDDAAPQLAEHPQLGNEFDANEGMYVNQGYWDSFVERFDFFKSQLSSNADLVSDRFMETGTIREAYSTSVIDAVKTSVLDFGDEQRNEILRTI